MPTLFSGTHPHKVEPRGRVSVPSDFRKVLREAEVSEVYLVPKMRDPRCHTFFTENGLLAFAESCYSDDMSPEDQRAVDQALIGSARLLTIDDLGRIVVPEEHRADIGVTSECVFVGGGGYFEMWEPATYDEYRQSVLERGRNLLGGKRMARVPI